MFGQEHASGFFYGLPAKPDVYPASLTACRSWPNVDIHRALLLLGGKLMYYVYALIDPRDNLVHYVGLTGSVPTKRIAEHLQDRTGAKAEWLIDLLNSAFMPTFAVLQTADDMEQAQMRESWWIATGELLGWPLTNIAKTTKRTLATARNAQGEIKREIVKGIAETGVKPLAVARKRVDITNAWFAANPQSATGPIRGVNELARYMAQVEGRPSDWQSYKSEAHREFHLFRDAQDARLPSGDKFGVDITGGAQ
jgi:hypothetical protein